uniref:non-specific serine/threonine protein kinase n=1 Tax=Aegilops tauschii TaxID=37682 RepID=N1R4D5_AEGTA
MANTRDSFPPTQAVKTSPKLGIQPSKASRDSPQQPLCFWFWTGGRHDAPKPLATHPISSTEGPDRAADTDGEMHVFVEYTQRDNAEETILVYEYVDNGNLEQWLHGDNGPVSPLSWDARMDIVLGTAKGITYLHEGLEPKVVHRDIKSSNILLDKRWNSKVSDFGLAKLLGSDSNYVTTRVMGTFGYLPPPPSQHLNCIHRCSALQKCELCLNLNRVPLLFLGSYVAPEYASTGMLNERSDVYSFGVLIMEIISGRCPVDYARPPTEVNLVEWLKKMVSNRDYEAVLDPKLPEKPSSKALKKALLVALRCVDPDSQKRPKMGHAIHMLEVDDFPYRDFFARLLAGSSDSAAVPRQSPGEIKEAGDRIRP